MSLLDAIKSGYAKFADFNGRSSQSEFWYFYLFSISVVTPILYILLTTRSSVFGVLALILLVVDLLSIPARLNVFIRRLHDTNHSGFWGLLLLLPLGIFVVVYWLCLPSDEGVNQYGDAPLGSHLGTS